MMRTISLRGSLLSLFLFIGLVGLYFGAARLSLLLAIPGTNASPVWPPSGIALAALLLRGWRMAPAIAIGALWANLESFAGHGPLTSAHWFASSMIAAGNTLEAVSAWFVLTHLKQSTPSLKTVRGAIYFVLAVPVATVIGAAIGALALLINGIIPQAIVGAVGKTWWMGDMTGILTITPFIVAWCRPAVDFRWGRARVGLLAVTVLAYAAILAWAFLLPDTSPSTSRLLMIGMLPILGCAAYLYQERGTSSVVLLMVTAALIATMRGRGMFEAGPINDVLIQFDILLCLVAIVGVLLSADIRDFSEAESEPAHTPLKAVIAPWATLFIGSLITLLAWHIVALANEDQAEQRFRAAVRVISQQIEQKLLDCRRLLIATAGLYIDRENVPRSVWRSYVASLNLDQTLPGVQGIGFARWISQEDLQRVVQQVRSEGFDDFVIKPSEPRKEYTAITVLEPLDARNRRAFGYDMWSEPTRRRAMSRALSTGNVTASGKVRLLQENGVDEQAGFLLYQPVYKPGERLRNIADRRNALIGFVYSPFRIKDLVENTLGDRFGTVDLEIHDQLASGPDSLMFSSEGSVGNVGGQQFGKLTEDLSINVGQHHWVLRMSTNLNFWAGIDQSKSRIVLVFGMLLATIAFLLVRTLSDMEQRASRLAKAMGVAYEEARFSFDSLVHTAPVPVVLGSGNGVIHAMNPAAKQFFSSGPDAAPVETLFELIDRRDSAPLRTIFSEISTGTNQLSDVVKVKAHSGDGGMVPTILALSFWKERKHRAFGAIFLDVSDQERANEFRRGIFDEGQDAMIISSREGRIVRANERAAQLFGYSREQMAQMEINDLLPQPLRDRHRVLQQKYAENPRWRAMGSGLDLKAVDAAGKEFPVEISLNVLNYSGEIHFVATVVDQTEKKAVEAALRSSLAFQASIQRSADFSIIATTTEGVILSFNAAAERMLGYRAEEMVGKRTPEAFHKAEEVVVRARVLSEELGREIEPGFEVFVARARLGMVDEREWTYIRKDGSSFPVRLSVTGLFDSNGILTGFLGIADDITQLKQHEAAQAQALQERETLLREVYHRVKNNLQVVGSLFNLQLRQLPEGEAREALLEAAQRVQSMALVHEKLYQSDSLESVSLDEYVGDLARQLIDLMRIESRTITLFLDMEKFAVGLEMAVPLGLLINELVTNSIKHGLKERGGEITIRGRSIEHGMVIEVEDTGPGFPDLKQVEKASSLGLRLIRTLTRQLDGKMEYLNQPGAFARLTITKKS